MHASSSRWLTQSCSTARQGMSTLARSRSTHACQHCRGSGSEESSKRTAARFLCKADDSSSMRGKTYHLLMPVLWSRSMKVSVPVTLRTTPNTDRSARLGTSPPMKGLSPRAATQRSASAYSSARGSPLMLYFFFSLPAAQRPHQILRKEKVNDMGSRSVWLGKRVCDCHRIGCQLQAQEL